MGQYKAIADSEEGGQQGRQGPDIGGDGELTSASVQMCFRDAPAAQGGLVVALHAHGAGLAPRIHLPAAYPAVP